MSELALEFKVVDEVPATERVPRPSRWDKAFEALPEDGRSVQIECESAPVARNVAATARQYAKARGIEGVRVSRRGAQVYLTRKS